MWSAAGVISIVVLSVAAFVLWLRAAEKAALPILDGDLHLNASSGAGLSAPVTVRRDAHGVPHIEAANQDDLFLAQGYVTAQDRLWQMDTLRRNANGELAEILGSSLLIHDKAQRVFQFRLAAQRIYTNLNPADRNRLDDYARGVNLFIAQHQDSLPAEFRLLHYRPQPWAGADSISIGAAMMAQTLDDHWDVKLAREEVAAKLHNPKLEADLYPVGSWRDHPPTGTVVDLSQPHLEPPAPPTSDDDDDDRSQASATPPKHRFEQGPRLPAHFAKPAKWMGHGVSATPNERPASFEDSTRLRAPSSRLSSGARVGGRESQSALGHDEDEDLRAIRASLGLFKCPGCIPGSNNWVIAGAHTASGKPLLSNDMHLGLTEPNIWFMADLQAPGFHVEGVTIPGVPFVIAGHNEHVAWGYTALYADVQDLYIEKLDGKGNYYQSPNGAEPGVWKPLTVDHEVIHVRGGKDVLLDVQSTAHGPLLNPLFKREIHPFTLKWTLYDPGLKGLPIYQLDIASSCAEATAALSIWNWPTLNVIYSDDQGHIAYHAVGSIPLRPGGLQGVPIQDTAHEWQGYIPFDQLPNSFDPPSGFLATANSRVTADTALYPLTLEWADPYRIQRIYKALQGRDQLTPKDLLAVEIDVYSEVDQEIGHRLAYAIDHTPGVDNRLRKAADLMRSWDGRLTADSAAASIVTQARRAFWPLILEPKLGQEAAEDYRWSESDFAEEEIIMHGNPESSQAWLPPAYKNWDALLTDAVRNGMKNGRAPTDVAKWTYGSWHVVDIEHPLAGFLPIISRIAGTGPQPLSGDTTTVKQVGRAFGPSQRFTMDWSNVDGSTEDIVLGESSDPYSPYFRDQWNDYYGGTTFAFPFTPAAVAAQTSHTLRLLP
jgi:penicillin amidase